MDHRKPGVANPDVPDFQNMLRCVRYIGLCFHFFDFGLSGSGQFFPVFPDKAFSQIGLDDIGIFGDTFWNSIGDL